MCAIGASIGYSLTGSSTLMIARRDRDGTKFLKAMAGIGVELSVAFMVQQFILIPGLNGVHFGKESYFLLIVRIVLGLVFFFKERQFFSGKDGFCFCSTK